jgi:hypothetical protein
MEERNRRAPRFPVHHTDDGIRVVKKLDLVLHFAHLMLALK